MFKRLIASVVLSPSAIGDLASYSTRLKKQTSYRVAASILILVAFFLELAVINMPTTNNIPPSRGINDIVSTKNSSGLEYSLETRNISQGNSDATSNPAQSSDQLVYTLRAKNTSGEVQSTNFSIDLRDVFDYASILGDNGASLDGTILHWPETIVEPGQDQVRVFTVKMARDISTAPMNELAFDCKMTTFYGARHDNVVRCSTVKTIETGMSTIPSLNTKITMTIISVALFTSLLLLFRNLQLRKELKIIRNLLTEGGL